MSRTAIRTPPIEADFRLPVSERPKAGRPSIVFVFGSADAPAHRSDCRGDDALESHAAEAQRISLLTSDLLDGPSSRPLVIDGMEDSVVPIEDSVLAAMCGKNKDLSVVANRGHMADPDGEEVIHRWLVDAADEGR